MKSYLRFLGRNKLYTAIEVVGLSIAIAFAIPMLCYNNSVRLTSKGHENYENIYSVCYNEMQGSSTKFGDFLKERIPEIEKVTTPVLQKQEILDDDSRKTDFVDKDFFYFFPCKFFEGDENFLDISGAVAVSADYAKVLASDGPVLGRQINGIRGVYTVAAIFDDYGSGILHKADMLVSNEIMKNFTYSEAPLQEHAMTLFSVREDSEMNSVEDKFRKCAVEYWGPRGESYRNETWYRLVRYDDITTDRSNIFGLTHNAALRWILGVICFLLFIIPLINYINLSVALTTKRAREMAMRRLNGADRSGVIMKYCAESLIFTTFCFLFGLLLTKVSVPALNSFIHATNGAGTTLAVSWTFSDMMLFIALILVTSLICGIIPAVLVSRFTPLDVTKGDLRYYSKKRLSKVFICFQSFISVIVISLSLVMEVNYGKLVNIDYHCNVDDVFYLNAGTIAPGKPEELREELMKHPEIISSGMIGYHSDLPVIGSARPYMKDQMLSFFYTHLLCDENAFDILEFEVKEQFDKDRITGLWLTSEAEITIAENPEFLQWLTDKEYIRHSDPAGRIETYPAHFLKSSHGPAASFLFVSPVSEIDFHQHLLIKTIPDHNAARKVIAEVYSKVYQKPVTDIMNFASESKYIREIHNEQLAPLYSTIKLMRLVLILIIALTMMGMTGMSVYYASERRHEISIRKVFGATTDSETFRNVLTYIRMTLISDILAIPAIYILLDLMKQTPYANTLNTSWWVYIAAISVSLLISLASVLWQTLRAARTNPAETLKKE